KPLQFTKGEHILTDVVLPPKPKTVEPPKPPKGTLPKPPNKATTMTVVTDTPEELVRDSVPDNELLAYNPDNVDGQIGVPDGVEDGTGEIPITPVAPPAATPPAINNWAEVMPEY